jgi:hypothetical protein
MNDDVSAVPTFAAVRHLARRRIEDQVVVLDLRRSRIYGLNPSAGEVLEALQEPLTLDQVAARFELAEGSAAPRVTDLDRFIAELVALGLIERRSNQAGGATVAARAAGSLPWVPPALLWQEEVARITSQISPPQQIGNPACLP